jgi:hypothetical protein
MSDKAQRETNVYESGTYVFGRGESSYEPHKFPQQREVGLWYTGDNTGELLALVRGLKTVGAVKTLHHEQQY